jgi:hypothetical protein
VVSGFYCWRDGWRDRNDTVITVLTQGIRGYMGAHADGAIAINAGGRHVWWGKVAAGKARQWEPSAWGESSCLVLSDGTAIGVDFTGASGSKVLLVSTGAAEGQTVRVGQTSLTFYSPQGLLAPVQVNGSEARIGRQRVRMNGERIEFGVRGR